MNYIKAFHIDNGRKFYSLEDLMDLINVMSENGYNLIELAFGNDGFRFLLDDMTVISDDTVYESEKVKEAIQCGNIAFCDNGTNELTQSEVEKLISYANSLGIEVMPLINTPGHMDAILTAMEKLGINEPAYKGSKTTVDFDNTKAVNFTKVLLDKYIKWFSDKGCKFFNLGSDEYANDVLTSGFASLQNPDEYRYDRFIEYVNEVALMIKNVGMTPVMFNDGVYYNEDEKAGIIDKDIVVSYWCKGWNSYDLASVEFVKAHGHKILDTNNEWYYVLGRKNTEGKVQSFTFEDSLEALETKRSNLESIGSMFCLWSDEPAAPYDDNEIQNMHCLLKAFQPK